MDEQRHYWNELAQHGKYASVIDPNDRRGCKNAYIIGIRDRVLLDSIRPNGSLNLILDFGCGTGNIGQLLVAHQQRVIGLDISDNLLQHAVRHSNEKECLFLRYDGEAFPLQAESFDFAVCYVVLSHITSDMNLSQVLQQIHRVLKPHGRFVVIEQTRRRRVDNATKVQRTRGEYCNLFTQSGFHVTQIEDIRSGHFPLIYLLRLGCIPKRSFPWIAKLDKHYCQLMASPIFDYRDTAFVLERAA